MNERHKRFVSEYLIDLNATRAYKSVYKCADKVANANGSRLLVNAEIQQAIANGQSRVAKKADLTIESHLATLETLRDQAQAANQFSAAINAESLRGKVAGFYKERIEHSGAVDLSPSEREQAVVHILTAARKRQKELVS